MWTYLNTEPQEVTQFYERVLSFPNPPSLQRLLGLPALSIVKKAVASGSTIPFDGLPDVEAQVSSENVAYDYTTHSENIVRIAQMYRGQDSVNVRIYNKIKHVFPIIEGHNWLNQPLDPMGVGIALDDKGTIARLPMAQAEIDQEISNTHFVTITGAEMMALCVHLHRLGVL